MYKKLSFGSSSSSGKGHKKHRPKALSVPSMPSDQPKLSPNFQLAPLRELSLERKSSKQRKSRSPSSSLSSSSSSLNSTDSFSSPLPRAQSGGGILIGRAEKEKRKKRRGQTSLQQDVKFVQSAPLQLPKPAELIIDDEDGEGDFVPFMFADESHERNDVIENLLLSPGSDDGTPHSNKINIFAAKFDSLTATIQAITDYDDEIDVSQFESPMHVQPNKEEEEEDKDKESSSVRYVVHEDDIINIRENLNKVERLHKVGNGNFGSVYQARFEDLVVAMKQIPLRNNLTKQDRKKLMFEFELHDQMAKHANVCHTIGSYLRFEGETEKLHVLMPFYNCGNVATFLKWLHHLKSHGEFANQEAELDSLLLLMVLDVAQGMSHMHKYDIIHRDLAARNLLISQQSASIAVSDFGLSRPLENTHHTATIGGIFPMNTPPEVINSNAFRKESDVYSFGMLVWAMYSYCQQEFHPLKGCTNMISIIRRITKGEVVEELEFDKLGVPAFVEHLIRSCLCVDPSDRPDFAEIEEQVWDEVGDTQTSREFFQTLLHRYVRHL